MLILKSMEHLRRGLCCPHRAGITAALAMSGSLGRPTLVHATGVWGSLAVSLALAEGVFAMASETPATGVAGAGDAAGVTFVL